MSVHKHLVFTVAYKLWGSHEKSTAQHINSLCILNTQYYTVYLIVYICILHIYNYTHVSIYIQSCIFTHKYIYTELYIHLVG